MTLLGLILCEESIARIYEAWKCLPDPDSGEIDEYIEAKIEKIWNFFLKIIFLGVIPCGESIVCILESWKWLLGPDSGQ